jgi:hypothetical protein
MYILRKILNLTYIKIICYNNIQIIMFFYCKAIFFLNLYLHFREHWPSIEHLLESTTLDTKQFISKSWSVIIIPLLNIGVIIEIRNVFKEEMWELVTFICRLIHSIKTIINVKICVV